MGGAFRTAGAPYRGAVNLLGLRPGDISHEEYQAFIKKLWT